MEREACVCDHRFERSDLCAEIIIIKIIINIFKKNHPGVGVYSRFYLYYLYCLCIIRW